MPEPLLLLLIALAAFRVTRLWIDDGWPLQRLRDAFLYRWPDDVSVFEESEVVKGEDGLTYTRAGQPLIWVEDGEYMAETPSKLGPLATCYWCAGWWISVAWVAAALLWPTVTAWIAAPFALSAVVGIIGHALDRE